MYVCVGKHSVYYCIEPLTQVELYTTCYKKNHGAGKYSCNLCASKKSCFNIRNCKSGRKYSFQIRDLKSRDPKLIAHVESYATCTGASLSLSLPVAYPRRQWQMMSMTTLIQPTPEPQQQRISDLHPLEIMPVFSIFQIR